MTVKQQHVDVRDKPGHDDEEIDSQAK